MTGPTGPKRKADRPHRPDRNPQSGR